MCYLLPFIGLQRTRNMCDAIPLTNDFLLFTNMYGSKIIAYTEPLKN
jgi:hypothetical protein